MIEQDLERFYSAIAVDTEVERRVRAAVTSRPGTSKRVPMVAGVLAAVAVVIVAVVWASVRHPNTGSLPADSDSPRPSVSPSSTAPSPIATASPSPHLLQSPPAVHNTVVGTIAFRGKPVNGAHVVISVFPENDHTPVGHTVTVLNFKPELSGTGGAYRVHVPRKAFTPKWSGSDYMNITVDVYSRSGSTEWNVPLDRHGYTTAPMRINFDLGKQTVTINGHTETCQVI